MRNCTLALLLIVAGMFTSAQAGLLTRGNIFADGLAGCSFGVVVGLVGGMVLTSPNPALGTATLAHMGVLGGCLTGLALAVGANGVVYLSDLADDILDQKRPLETLTTMVYPATPSSSAD